MLTNCICGLPKEQNEMRCPICQRMYDDDRRRLVDEIAAQSAEDVAAESARAKWGNVQPPQRPKDVR